MKKKTEGNEEQRKQGSESRFVQAAGSRQKTEGNEEQRSRDQSLGSSKQRITTRIRLTRSRRRPTRFATDGDQRSASRRARYSSCARRRRFSSESFFLPRRTTIVIASVAITGTKIDSATTSCVQPSAV